MRPILAAAFLVVASLVSAGCAGPAAGPPPGQSVVWSFTDIDGMSHNQTGALGSPTLLFFMATWCGDCRTKAQWLDDVVAEHADRDLSVYSVSTSPSTDTEAKLRQWMEEFNHGWPHGVDRDGAMQEAFGVRQQSTLVVLDAQGVHAETLGYGRNDADGLRQALETAYEA
jgi:cytochrome oxidase Cu insertion factor (SCO1/SenC/PrrC family)